MNEPLDTIRGANVLRFGTFELDAPCGELRRRGLRVHLQEMPLQVLLMLLERPGELVRRDDFYTRLWPNDALGILDDNLNTAVAKLRVALDDSARNPRFIETVPRRGYRFVAPVNGHARARADAGGNERPANGPASHAAASNAPPEVDRHARTAASTADSKREPELRRIGSLFVGREREMEQLRHALRDSGSGRRYVVLAAGEAGIGKTRMAEQLNEEADEIGTRVVWGRSLEEHGGQPYWPWVQILRSLIESSPDDVLREDMGACAGDIARIVPELSARLGVYPPETLANAEQDRFRLFDSIAEYLRRAARRRPLMLVFDSLHWSGRPSLLLLEFVAQSLVESALLILGNYRASEVTREHPLFHTLGALNRESRFIRLQLRGLSLEATAELVSRASGVPWPASLVEAIQRQTEGNPFFVSEVAQLLVEEQVLERRGDGMQPAAGRALVVRIPEGIREVIGKRLVRLSRNCNTLLSHAAVAGREFDLDVLRLLMQELDEDALLDALEEALACGAIEEAQPHNDRYRFTHALIKETLYDEISPAQRARRHARVGDALERLRSADLAPHLSQIAHQYAKAAASGRAAQAVDYCTRAGEQAESLRAYEEAASHYQMGLEALRHEEHVDALRRCHLLLAAARSMSKGGHVAETLDFVQRGAECALRLGHVDGLVEACRIIDYIVANLGVGGSQALPILEQTLAVLGDDDSATRAALLGALTRACYSAGQPERGEVTMRESLAMARRVGDAKALVSALRARLYVRHPEDLDHRLAAAREMLDLAERLGDREAQREAHDMCFYDLIEKADVEAADAHLARAGEIGRAIRQPFHAHNHLVYRTMRVILQGRYEEGERLAREALEAGLRLRCASADGIFAMQMFTIRRDQGRLDELVGALKAFTSERPLSATWRPGLAVLYAELGMAEEARAELEHLARDDYAAIPRDVLWATCLAYLVEVADFLHDCHRAEQLYGLLRPYEGRLLTVGSCVACLGASSHYLGMLSRCLGEPERAAAQFEDAIALDARTGARPWLARTQLRLASLLLERGSAADVARARELTGAALAGARELGMAAVVAKASAFQESMG